MAYDTVIDKARHQAACKATADAIRGKTGNTAKLTWDPDTGFKNAVNAISTGSTGIIPTGTKTITMNGTHNVSEYEYAQVNVSANASPTLQSKSVTPKAAAQTVKPDTGYDGLSQVTVSGDSDLVASNIKKGVQIFNVTGTYEGTSSAELPTLTNRGYASDLAMGKELIGPDGSIVTGTVREYSDSYMTPSFTGTIEWDDDWAVRNTLDEDVLLRKNTVVTTWLSYDVFGNASPSDVRQGVTFTSRSGIKQTGTATMGGSGGASMVTREGTTTTATFDTGLSEIVGFLLKRNTTTSTGLMNVSAIVPLGIYTYGYCSSYSDYFKNYGTATGTLGDTLNYCVIDGGTVSWTSTGTSAFVEGGTYTWQAVGYA